MSNHIKLTDQVAGINFTDGSLNEIQQFTLPNHQFDVPSSLCPADLFVVKINRFKFCFPAYRFIRKDNDRQMLMFVDGACSNNGSPDARAGWAVCVGSRVVKRRLEPPEVGSTGGQTSNRAELRSVIVALTLRSWKGEGFDSVVIASDSEYVVKGYCEYLEVWKQRGWKTSTGIDVKNKDLWEVLDSNIRSLAKEELQVLFWRIPREWNEADKYAKEATTMDFDSTSTSSAPIYMAEI